MKKKVRILLILELVLLGILLGSVLFLSLFVQAGGRVYFRGVSSLDLRGQEISVETYDALSRKLPECGIVWSVPFQGGFISSTQTELTITSLTEEDVLLLDYLPHLETVHAEACTDFLPLAQLQRRRPSCRVLFRVPLGGELFDQDTETLSLSSITPEELPLLECFLRLNRVEISGCCDYEALLSYQQAHPEWNLTYTVRLGEGIYPSDSESITVENASYQELAQGLVGLTKLHTILLRNPESDYEGLTALRQEFPQVSINWELTLGDRTFPSDTRELDISFMPIGSLEDAERIANYFPDLEKLILDSGSIDNDTMAEFRERKRADYKVVWTVICGTGKFGAFPVRTDETTFMPLKHRIYYFHDDDMYNLRYCEDMVCIDVGHMTFTDVSFVENMPHLKYLILNLTSVKDITPLSTCKELVFLELDHSWVQDYSPLLGCTALEDLNLGDTYGDPAPIAQMTWLKNLWWVGQSFDVKTELQETLTNTNMLFHSGKDTTGYGWRQLPNYYAMRDMLEMPYMK